MDCFNFKSVGLNARSAFERFLNHSGNISCEWCFANIFAWSRIENTEYCIHGDYLLLRNSVNGSVNYYFPAYGYPNLDTVELRQIILNIFDCNGKNQPLTFVHLLKEQADVLSDLFTDRFSFTTDRNYSEYIYDAEAFRTYSGKKLHGKRNHYNKFMSSYGAKYSYEEISGDNISECLTFSEEWSKINRYYLNDSLTNELDIVKSLLKNFTALGLIGGLIRIGDEVKGFTIGEIPYLGADTVVIHVEKAMYDIEGLYPAMASVFLRHNPQFKYVNREDDLGDEGLRDSKLSYRPLYLLDKYTAEAKN